MIFHVAKDSDWQAARRTGIYEVSTLGRTLSEEGFIHASHRHQVDGVLDRFYSDVTEPLVVLAIDPDRLGCEVRDEHVDGNGESFPHIYGPIPLAAVVDVEPVAGQAGSTRNSPPDSDMT